MPAPQPKTKAQDLEERYGPRLSAWDEVIDEFTLRRMLAEVIDAKRHADREGLVVLNTLEGMIEGRRGLLEKALDAYRRAYLLAPNEPGPVTNFGKALLDTDRADEALPHLLRAASVSGTLREDALLMRLNLAVCYARVGREDEANETFDLAIARADLRTPQECIALALTAAAIERHEDSVELVARYLCAAQREERGDDTAMTILHAAPAELVERVRADRLLMKSLAAVEAQALAPIPDDMQNPGERALSPQGWENFVRLVGG